MLCKTEADRFTECDEPLPSALVLDQAARAALTTEHYCTWLAVIVPMMILCAQVGRLNFEIDHKANAIEVPTFQFCYIPF